jgi:phosphomannomutase
LPRRLFGTAGIRMKYPGEFDAVLAYRLGLAAAKVVGGRGEAYVVHDTRTTGPLLTLAFMSGLMAGGVSTGYVGVAPTPVAAYAASRLGGSLGASVTASHNPPEYNGLKLYDSEGYEFTRDLEERIEEFVETAEPGDWRIAKGFFHAEEAVSKYIGEMVSRLEPSRVRARPRVLVDPANGATYMVTPTVLRMLGARVVTVNSNPDGFFPGRSPEPRKDVLEPLLPFYRAASPDLILAHDGDGDRLAVLDLRAGFVRQDRLIAFYAALLLRERKGTVIVSIDTGRVVDVVAERLGGRVERYRLGKTHERLKQLGASHVVLAAEPWKLIDPRWGPWVDGVWQAALITKTLIEEGKPLATLLDELGIPDYPWDRRSYLLEPTSLRDNVYEELVEDLKTALGEPAKVLSIDGMRYEYDDGSWVLVRKSGTEPKLRVYSEAETRDRLREIVETVDKLVKNAVERHGGKIVEVTIG